MRNKLLAGLAAGAVGTMTLDIATYVDMVARGRPSSGVPAKLAGMLADKAGINLAAGAQGDEQAAKETVQSRESGLGALLGYVPGLGIGALYGLLRPQVRRLPVPVVGVVVGLAAMAASDTPIVTSGVSDPATWGVSGWMADLIPHLAYGVMTAIAYDAFTA